MGTFTKFFYEMTKEDLQEAGGKAANLGELTQAGFNVPAGFCILADALKYLIESNNLQPQIDSLSGAFDYDDYPAMEVQTAEIRRRIIGAGIPVDLEKEVSAAIDRLIGTTPAFAAVRSSVAVKNSTLSSFPGMMDTFHYLKGKAEIIKHIRECWASLWTTRAAYNRHHKNIDHGLGLIAPVVQLMIHPEVAGVLFTANPISGNRGEMVIESNWGLGESVVSGKSLNDFFALGKTDLKITTKKIAKKTVMVDFDEEQGSGRRERVVDPDKMDAPTLREDQVRELGEQGLKIEALFGFPQDIEWAYEKNRLFILQSRNIKNLKE
jgi:pyruvate, water dikinase